MKAVRIIVKVALALAAVAGVVYLAATYGDRIVAWAKGLLKGKCCCGSDCACGDECVCDDAECTCECAEEAPVEATDEAEPVAAEADFEG